MITSKVELKELRAERKLLKAAIAREKRRNLSEEETEEYQAHLARFEELNKLLDDEDGLSVALWIPIYMTFFSLLFGALITMVMDIVYFVVYRLTSTSMSEIPAPPLELFSWGSTLSLVFLILFIVFKYRKRGWFDEWKADRKNLSVGRTLFEVSCILLIFYAISDITSDYFTVGTEFLTGKDIGYSDSETLLSLLYACIAAPIVEEILFRGLLLGRLSRISKLGAVVFSSFCFSLMHGDFTQMFGAIYVGFVLGYVYLEYGLRYSILLHMLNNVDSCFSPIIRRTEGFAFDGTVYPVSSIISISLGVLGTIAIIWAFKTLIPRVRDYVAEYKANRAENKAAFVLCMKRCFSNGKTIAFIITAVLCIALIYGVPA